MKFIIPALCLLGAGCSEQLLSTVGGPKDSSNPAIEVTPAHLNFGILADGDTVVQSFRVTNIGQDVLDVSHIQILGSGTFSLLDETLEFSLQPSAHTTIEVAFTQVKEAFSTDQVAIYSNDPEDAVVGVDLAGFGMHAPPYNEEDCAQEEPVSWSPAELIVGSWNSVSASGAVHVATAGWYAIFDTALSESGSSQTNETGILQISNAANPDGWPLFGNCGDWWIVADSDNGGSPSDTPVYLGTFWLESGENQVTLYHYCTVYRSGQCPEFHNDTPAGGHCESSNWNSIHMQANEICLTTHPGN